METTTSLSFCLICCHGNVCQSVAETRTSEPLDSNGPFIVFRCSWNVITEQLLNN